MEERKRGSVNLNLHAPGYWPRLICDCACADRTELSCSRIRIAPRKEKNLSASVHDRRMPLIATAPVKPSARHVMMMGEALYYACEAFCDAYIKSFFISLV